jgi:hypothetical protein
MHEVNIKKLHKMFHAVSRLITGIPAVFVQYCRNTPVLQLSKATNHRTHTMSCTCVHQKHGLQPRVQQSVHDVERLSNNG